MPVEIGRDIDEFEVGMSRSYTRTFTADDIERFAEITGDHNYFHVNEEAARHSVFGRRIAQGLLVASMSTHMGGMVFPGPGYIAAHLNTTFLKPVYIGDTVTVTIEITSVDRGREWLEMTARWVNQDGELVAEGTSAGRPTKVAYEPTEKEE
jgi:3-hydroxybutyryl-CoA dehydratase